MAATTRSYSGVQRSGMISATGVADRRQATPHWHGPKRGTRTSTTPNSEIRRRGRRPLSGRCAPHRSQRRRLRQCSSTCAVTRWRCTAARTALPSSRLRPSVAAVCPVGRRSPELTSCRCGVPSGPTNSSMIRHRIVPRPATASGGHSTPQVLDGLVHRLERSLHGDEIGAVVFGDRDTLVLVQEFVQILRAVEMAQGRRWTEDVEILLTAVRALLWLVDKGPAVLTGN